jgi:hypothetical protein
MKNTEYRSLASVQYGFKLSCMELGRDWDGTGTWDLGKWDGTGLS